MTPLIIHYINVCLMFYLMCCTCLSVLFTICSFNHTWEQLRCHTTFSNQAVTLHSATRLSHYIQQPGRHIQLSICGIAVQRAATAALHSYITLWAINLFAEVHL